MFRIDLLVTRTIFTPINATLLCSLERASVPLKKRVEMDRHLSNRCLCHPNDHSRRSQYQITRIFVTSLERALVLLEKRVDVGPRISILHL